MQDIRRCLAAALEDKGWSVADLLKRSRLGCTRASLHRKIYGYRKGAKRVYQPITLDELRALTNTLDLRVDVGARAA